MAVGTAATSTLTETWDGSVWSIVPSPSPSSTGNSLTSVSCMSPLDCVAVGDYTDTTGTSEGLAEIWNGSTWSVVPTVSEGGDDVVLQSVSCAPSTFCVAVGDVSAPANYSEAEPLAETWDGTNWSEDLLPPLPDDSGEFTSVSCTISTNCMTVGETYSCAQVKDQIVCFGYEALAESWDGTSWTIDATPDEGLYSVSCTGPTSCVGATGSSIDAWDGTSWSETNGSLAGGSLSDLSCVNDTQCMAVGEYQNPSAGAQAQTLTMSWNGTTLSAIPSVDPDSTLDLLNGVSCVSATFCAAVGAQSTAFQPLFETWNGSTWAVAPTADTAVVLPSTGSTVGGTGAVLDATASASSGVASVKFALSGGSYDRSVIGTAVPTLYGWIYIWNTTGVPANTYTLQSLVTDDDGDTVYSPTVSVIVNNTPPSTTVLIPSTGASLKGTSAVLDASASTNDGVAISKVQFTITGGHYDQSVIGTATPTLYGWICVWNTTGVPDGPYILESLVTDAVGNTASSPGVSVSVANTPPSTTVLIPSTGASLKGTSAVLDASASTNDGVAISKVAIYDHRRTLRPERHRYGNPHPLRLDLRLEHDRCPRRPVHPREPGNRRCGQHGFESGGLGQRGQLNGFAQRKQATPKEYRS